MRLQEFDYALPPELVAQEPAARREAARLMVLRRSDGAIAESSFGAIGEHLRPGDLLVLNDTRVIKARLHGRKDTGGEVEVLVERIVDPHVALAQVRASKSPRPGRRLLFARGAEAEVLDRAGEFFRLRFDDEVLRVLDAHGEVPLPPYIGHAGDREDEARYQTVYAREPGAVAAPTAGLHFDEALIASLQARGVVIAYVTLHVGAGTFQPVRVEDLSKHVMHAEWYGIPQATVDAIARARRAKKRVVSVGTTTLRALESAAAGGELRAGTAESLAGAKPR